MDINISDQSIISVLSTFFDINKKDLKEEIKNFGDIGDWTSFQKFDKKNNLTVEEVCSNIEKIYELEGK